MEFKLGHNALCIDNDNGNHLLNVGKMYKVEGIDRTSSYIMVRNETGYCWWYENHLFKPVTKTDTDIDADEIDYIGLLKNI